MNQVGTELVIFGEVLFDQFENGSQVLGGAPFNVAWHLQGFGLDPLFISRIGSDKQGNIILDKMSEWNMSTQGIQIDSSHPTGTVSVSIRDDQPDFNICDQQAYDYIEPANLTSLLFQTSNPILYHGSLVQRNKQSRRSLSKISSSLKAKRFIDVNLRPPWYSLQDIKSSIAEARWLKLNEQEFSELCSKQFISDQDLESSLKHYFANTDLEMLILTRAEKGAVIVSQEDYLTASAPEIDSFLDAVGAGDGFSAVTLIGILHEWRAEDILCRSLDFASEICRHQGAIISDRGIYETKRVAWNV